MGRRRRTLEVLREELTRTPEGLEVGEAVLKGLRRLSPGGRVALYRRVLDPTAPPLPEEDRRVMADWLESQGFEISSGPLPIGAVGQKPSQRRCLWCGRPRPPRQRCGCVRERQYYTPA